MIQLQSVLTVSDNSGAKTVKCIKVLGGFKKKYAKLGDTIVVSVQQLRNKSKKRSKVKKKEIYRAIITRTQTGYKKKTGLKHTFFDNAVILLNKQKKLIGTRLVGPLSKIFKKKSFQKIIGRSTGFI